MASNSTAVNSDSNNSPGNSPSEFVGIVSWFLLVVSGFAIFARLSTKYAIFKRLDTDDGLSIASLLFNIGAGVAVTIICANGLGKNIHSLDDIVLEKFEKSLYTLGMLYITTLCFAKLSILMLLRTISPSRLHRRLGLSIGAFIAVWGGISVLVSAFQCKVPNVWQTENNQCLNKSAFWHVVGVMNLITDTMLILFPFFIVKSLNMSTRRKFTVMGSFAARSCDIVATAVQLAYTSSFSSSDFTSDLWQWILIAQIIQTITITTSCIPYFRPLLKSYPSGMYSIDESMHSAAGTRRTQGYSQKTNHVYVLRDTNPGASKSANSTVDSKKPGEDFAYLESRRIGATSEIETVPIDKRSDSRAAWDSSSQRSQSRIIKATTTIETSWQNERN